MATDSRTSSKKFTKAEKSWILYDWANSVYATNIMAVLFLSLIHICPARRTGKCTGERPRSAAGLRCPAKVPANGPPFPGMFPRGGGFPSRSRAPPGTPTGQTPPHGLALPRGCLETRRSQGCGPAPGRRSPGAPDVYKRQPEN